MNLLGWLLLPLALIAAGVGRLDGLIIPCWLEPRLWGLIRVGVRLWDRFLKVQLANSRLSRLTVNLQHVALLFSAPPLPPDRTRLNSLRETRIKGLWAPEGWAM